MQAGVDFCQEAPVKTGAAEKLSQQTEIILPIAR